MLFFHWLIPLAFFINGPTLHPYYVSVTEMEYNAQAHSIEVSCRFFTDDFEHTLHNAFQKKADLLKPDFKEAMNPLVKAYILQHLKVSVNGMFKPLNYIGFEGEPEATTAYFEILDVDRVTQIVLSNTLLYDYKPEQIGLMHVTVNGKRKSYKLVNPNSEAVFSF